MRSATLYPTSQGKRAGDLLIAIAIAIVILMVLAVIAIGIGISFGPYTPPRPAIDAGVDGGP
jgi:hypothetical protein